jgi:hypothetical protein
MGFCKMIKADEVAVCVSGLAREGHEKAIKIAREIFPYDFFYMHWKGYDIPDVKPIELFDEPVYDYHNLLDTKYKPDCHIFRRYAEDNPERGLLAKIKRKPGAMEKTRNNSKQILAHFWLVNTLPKKYKTIIKFRYDTLLNKKLDWSKYIEMAQKDIVVGFGGSAPGGKIDTSFKEHTFKDCKRCPGPYLWDHLIIHPRHKLINVEKEFKNKNLLGAEWGWHQILHHQHNDNNYVNVQGGNVLVSHLQDQNELLRI